MSRFVDLIQSLGLYNFPLICFDNQLTCFDSEPEKFKVQSIDNAFFWNWPGML